MKNKIKIAFVCSLLIMAIFLGYLRSALGVWVEPTASPPQNNIASPIYKGSTAQEGPVNVKDITVGTGKGKIEANKFCLCDEITGNCDLADCITSWPAAGGYWTQNAANEIYYNGGNVGIGTNDPERQLHIVTDNVGTPTMIAVHNTNATDSSGATMLSLRGNSTGAGTTPFREAIALLGKIDIHDNATWTSSLRFLTAVNGDLDERMRISNTGKIGIGTSAPAEILELVDDTAGSVARLRITDEEDNPELQLQYGIVNNKEHWAIFADKGNGNSLNIWSWNGEDAKEGKRLTILQNGNVGIGEVSPLNKLTVKTNDANSAIYAEQQGSGYAGNFKGRVNVMNSNYKLKGNYNPAGAQESNRVFVLGNYAYVTDQFLGLQIIDISNPDNPFLKGDFNMTLEATGIDVRGNYAYVANGFNGLRVMNVSNPANPTVEDTCDTPSSAHSVDVLGNYAYVADEYSGLQVINISNPSATSIIGDYDTPGAALDIYVQGNYAYIADYTGGLQIIDISNPAHPVFKGSYSAANTYYYSIYVSGNYAYLGNSWEFEVLDISNPASPIFKGKYNPKAVDPIIVGGGIIYLEGTIDDIYVSGDYAYTAAMGVGLGVIDISNPVAPTLKGSFSVGNPDFYGVYVRGNDAYIADGSNGLQIVDINSFNADNVNVKGNLKATGDIFTSGDIKITSGKDVCIEGGNCLSVVPSSGDNLGNHTATQNIRLNNSWLSSDGGNEGIYILNNGNVGINMATPNSSLQVNGSITRQGSSLLGDVKNTHVNLGENSITGDNDSPNVGYMTISGGNDNIAKGEASTVSGGYGNLALNESATVAGGSVNQAEGAYSMVAGGDQNRARGKYSFAAGHRAKALHAGSFVWADSQDEDYSSGGNNEFRVRASGGVYYGSSQKWDIAEFMDVLKKDSVKEGEIVSMAEDDKLGKSFGAYDEKIIGVVSGKKTTTLHLADQKPLYGDTVRLPISLVGRVYVKVNNETGAIKVGDPITSSSQKGIGMKAIKAGKIIGYAMETADFNRKGESEILVFVNISYYVPESEWKNLYEMVNSQQVEIKELKNILKDKLK